MLEVDLKIVAPWIRDPLSVKYEVARQVSFAEVEPKALLAWFCGEQRYFQCGYTINLDSRPLNGYFDVEIEENAYFIDHSGGALSFLRAVVELAQGKKAKQGPAFGK